MKREYLQAFKLLVVIISFTKDKIFNGFSVNELDRWVEVANRKAVCSILFYLLL